MWSYPNVFRDQRRGPNAKEGKELCDVMVLCGHDVILFSDKSCTYPNTGDRDLDWCRWFKRAIQKAAKSLYGAERWIREFPGEIYLDRQCTKRLPQQIPDKLVLNVHRIIVARGAKERCREELGGSGSFIVAPDLVGSAHVSKAADGYGVFRIGRVSETGGFVHVFDEVILECALCELDTISDLLRYLRSKEQHIEDGKIAMIAGEENLISHFLTTMGTDGHAITEPAKGKRLLIEDGHWENYVHSEAYRNRRIDNEPSYLWDRIIDDVAHHAFSGTLMEGADARMEHTELVLRTMARESRFDRRVLSNKMIEIERESDKKDYVMRTILSEHSPELVYVFVFLKENIGGEKDYRRMRRALVENYMFLLAWKYRERKTVVGIATEARPNSGKSHDVALFHVDEWTEELEREGEELQRKTGLLKDSSIRYSAIDEREYRNETCSSHNMTPVRQLDDSGSRAMRIARNAPCPCGSGRKYKKCCGHPGDDGRSIADG